MMGEVCINVRIMSDGSFNAHVHDGSVQNAQSASFYDGNYASSDRGGFAKPAFWQEIAALEAASSALRRLANAKRYRRDKLRRLPCTLLERLRFRWLDEEYEHEEPDANLQRSALRKIASERAGDTVSCTELRHETARRLGVPVIPQGRAFASLVAAYTGAKIQKKGTKYMATFPK